MIRIVVAALILCVSVVGVQAQNVAVIKERKATFKGILPDLKVAKAMVQEKAPFDKAAAQKTFQTYAAAAKKLATLFPDDSKTGEETRALPAIWEKKDDFLAKMATFQKDSEEAAASVADLASLKAAWGKVMANCGGCHKPYRAPKKK